MTFLNYRQLLPIAGVLAGIFISYWGTIEKLAAQWQGNEDFSHGLLIVPISLYLIWTQKEKLQTADVKPEWRALALILFAVCIYIIGELGAELFTTRVSMLVFTIGAVWMLYGSQVISILRFPLLFLFVMLPLPGFIYRNVTFSLQLLSSKCSVALLQLMGLSVYREGNVIDMGFAQFQVVEACNGLRFILPLFTLGLLFAYFGRKVMWKRILLVAATIPFAIAANIIRIAGTGIIARQWGVEAAQGFFHSFSGWAVFMLCFGFFALLNWGLKALPGESKAVPADGRNGADAEGQEADEDEKTDKQAKAADGGIPWKHASVIITLALLLPLAVQMLGSVPPRPLKKPLSEFPLTHADYTGTFSEMDAAMWERVGGQKYIIIDYKRPGNAAVNFYTAYYEYQRKAGDFIHSPKLCLPGAGWFIEQSRVRSVPLGPEHGSAGSVRFNELLIRKGGFRQLVYYWYQGRDRNFTSEYAAKFYMVWDGIFRRRTDGALVRLMLPLAENMDADAALENGRAVQDDFAAFAAGQLSRYLP